MESQVSKTAKPGAPLSRAWLKVGHPPAGSFFSIRARVAKILPEPLTMAPMRMLPILLVFVAMFYWLWKVRRRPLPGLIRNEAMPLGGGAK